MRAGVQGCREEPRRPALEILPWWKPRWQGAVYGESGLRLPATVERERRLEGSGRTPSAS